MIVLLVLLVVFSATAKPLVAQDATPMVAIPGGSWRPFFPGKDEAQEVQVAPFLLEERAVSNQQYLAFVRENPQWRRSRAVNLFADDQYLTHWSGDLDFAPELADSPVVYVSWFAARAYAAWAGRRLPSMAEWEFAARASETDEDGTQEPEYNQRILDWYSNVNKERTSDGMPVAGDSYRSIHGVWNLHGLVWEWVEDFNTALVTGESRGDTSLDRDLFCGSGSVGSADPRDYASFMRYALRSSLDADYGLMNLGFRCAQDLPATHAPATDTKLPDCCAELPPFLSNTLPESSLWRVTAEWSDQTGMTRSLSEFRGKVVISTMIFTHCAYACPRTMATLLELRDLLPGEMRDRIHFLLVSFDHQRDLPPVLQSYAAGQNLDPSAWTLLHGSADAVRTWAAATSIRYKQTDTGDFAHSNRILLLGPDGRAVQFWDGLGVDPGGMVRDIATYMETIGSP